MNDIVKYWSDKLYKFDWGTDFSDDYSVYRRGKVARENLQKEWTEANLSDEVKSSILESIKESFDDYVTKSKEKYPVECANYRLWDDSFDIIMSCPKTITMFVEAK